MDYDIWRGVRELCQGYLWEDDTGTGTSYPEVAAAMPEVLNDEHTQFRITLRDDLLGTGTNAPVVIDKSVNPDLGEILPADIGPGFIEVRERGQVFLARGALFVSGGQVWLLKKSGDTVRLTTAGGDHPSGSPDGAKFAFASSLMSCRVLC